MSDRGDKAYAIKEVTDCQFFWGFIKFLPIGQPCNMFWTYIHGIKCAAMDFWMKVVVAPICGNSWVPERVKKYLGGKLNLNRSGMDGSPCIIGMVIPFAVFNSYVFY